MAELTTIKAEHLKKGDTVGLIAPASPIFERGSIEFVFEKLVKLGLKYKLGKHVFDSYSDMAGQDEARLEDFHAMWSDPEVNAIIPLRGGHGCSRFLPGVDFNLIAKNPKLIIGYSDLTGLLNLIYQKTGLITLHGPMANSFYRSNYTEEYFVKATMSNKPLGMISDPLFAGDGCPPYPPPRMVIAEGEATGKLAGGCLAIIRELLGTPFELDCKNKILFIEDVNEQPHSIDRFLTQLLLTGKLQQAKGIIVGELPGCRPGTTSRRTFSLNHSVEEVVIDRLSALGIPVIYGMRLGHGEHQFTLPIGAQATLKAKKGKVSFQIDEAACL
ncbi:MAG: LD-carboxypeptidase [Candidatus Obscuribacterales bacterium]|jgi:muramoyltetrapeptide carboxypeptidase|nr:LD-carboxypeptidase [Candidatus Obscuribacterales bacterium]